MKDTLDELTRAYRRVRRDEITNDIAQLVAPAAEHIEGRKRRADVAGRIEVQT
ncbi:hypothetical protein [Paraburkholderia graminis]|uniref:Uncharacterized protein n=1 Tax=Paraburkholderia graminis TaxID=60548 RepID=A0ABD5CU64_9BURK|nr:hypothetical protein [Paraburkholderia graminis]MDR6207914.1 hypothetical protein [Paraburkholderia graminis]